MPASADSKNKRVANSSPATRQTIRQQGGTGEDSYIHLADWTRSVAEIEKKFLAWSGRPNERTWDMLQKTMSPISHPEQYVHTES